jgi:hypothetical protein
MEDRASSRRAVFALIGALEVGGAATFLLAAALHSGARLALGPVVIAEPRIVDATVVESICALGLAVSACAVLTRRPWAWPAALIAHAVAAAGVLLGMAALAAGLGPQSTLNYFYHRVMLVLLVAGLVLLLLPVAKAALGYRDGTLRAG